METYLKFTSGLAQEIAQYPWRPGTIYFTTDNRVIHFDVPGTEALRLTMGNSEYVSCVRYNTKLTEPITQLQIPDFILNAASHEGLISVYWNGMLLTPNDNYTISDDLTAINFLFNVYIDDIIDVYVNMGVDASVIEAINNLHSGVSTRTNSTITWGEW